MNERLPHEVIRDNIREAIIRHLGKNLPQHLKGHMTTPSLHGRLWAKLAGKVTDIRDFDVQPPQLHHVCLHQNHILDHHTVIIIRQLLPVPPTVALQGGRACCHDLD